MQVDTGLIIAGHIEGMSFLEQHTMMVGRRRRVMHQPKKLPHLHRKSPTSQACRKLTRPNGNWPGLISAHNATVNCCCTLTGLTLHCMSGLRGGRILSADLRYGYQATKKIVLGLLWKEVITAFGRSENRSKFVLNQTCFL